MNRDRYGKPYAANHDAWGRPKMVGFPVGVRHELGTFAPVRWTEVK